MVNGYLRIFVLKELMSGTRSGYSLMRSVGDILGKRPSPGSMYPLLKEMESSGMITISASGEKGRYMITRKGRAAISRFLKEKEGLILQHIRLCRSVRTISGPPSCPLPGKSDLCDGVFERNFDLVQELREILVKSMREGENMGNEQKARKILERAILDLRRIPWGS